MSSSPWYHQGLRFQCIGCGNCCTGEPGYVWVNRAEIQAMADALRISPAEFESLSVRRVGRRRSLIEFTGGDCVLFDAETCRCRVYGVRPRQCRTWPFWESTLETPSDWESTSALCPGCGQGPIVPLAMIETQKTMIRV